MTTEPQTIPAALRAAAERHDAEALADGDVRLTWRELHDAVRATAAALIGHGVEPGDRVAIWSPNTHHWVRIALGALYAGATLVPINTRFTAAEALDILERTGARALFVAGTFLGADRLAALHETAPGGVPGIAVRIPVETDEPEWDSFLGRADSVPTERVEARADAVTPDQVSDILFTSGTTGRSKGAMSAHRQVLAVARAWAACGEVTAEDRYLVINPFFHSFGYKAGIAACLVTGATLVPQRVFDVAEAMRLVAAEKITVLPGPPTIYSSMLDAPDRDARDLTSLRLAVTGAATVPVALVERMQRELSFDTVLTAYGLTEAVVATMCRPDDDPETVANTCGRATADFEVRLDAWTGEVLLRGPNTMLGYLDDPDATATAIDSDGWLRTGDVGTLDERGYLKLTDRLKDMYICGGFNVYPAEVEQALARLDGVAESAVIGVPDTRLGEVGKAYIIARPGAALSEDRVIEHCRERLANYKAPRHVEFVAELPRNATGKILKRVLREGAA
ncbi:MAG: AMP-binding protein [Micromonosporaceae bacterium]|nr:AMP-binding protein [Micromonosporaceae bacterium]